MSRKFIASIGVIGSLASIIGLLYVFLPKESEKTIIDTIQNQSGSNNIQAGEKIIVNNYSNQSSKPTFVHREEIEGPYINEWYAQPLTSTDATNKRALTVLILGEGKTVEFSGILSFKCDGGYKSWRSVQNFYQTITDESEIMKIVPEAVYHTTCRMFYHKIGTYVQ